MIREAQKYALFRILLLFVRNPSTSAHIGLIAKKAKTSPATAMAACNVLLKAEILSEKKVGNLRVFSISPETPFAKAFKTAFSLEYLRENGLEKIGEGAISFAVYGSYASGDYDEHSDLDLLMLFSGMERNADTSALELEKKTGVRVEMKKMHYAEWGKRKRNGDTFTHEVLAKHILISGAEL